MRAIDAVNEQHKDICHHIGQALAYPLTKAFGRSFQVVTYRNSAGGQENDYREVKPSLFKRISAIVLFFLFLPVTAPAAFLGGLFVKASGTHPAGVFTKINDYLQNMADFNLEHT